MKKREWNSCFLESDFDDFKKKFEEFRNYLKHNAETLNNDNAKRILLAMEEEIDVCQDKICDLVIIEDIKLGWDTGESDQETCLAAPYGDRS